MAPDTYNRLPSGLMARPSGSGSGSSSSDSSSSQSFDNSGSGGSSLPLILSIIAILLGAASLYISMNNTSAGGITAADRTQLLGIAQDLRSLQQKQFSATSPDLQTVVSVEKSFPLSDILPTTFYIPLSLNIPVQGMVTGVSANGQVATFRVNDTLQLRASVPVDITNATNGIMVNINKDIPITTRIRSSFQVSMVFGDELNSIIQRLETMGSTPAAK